ncbi:putative S-methyl-5'-thioinosine phosphorylase [Thiohalobacter sp. COW1]|uniref:S-methyl-5'-thioinosine phosphorylase n=1 Tax=Thiohalobacter sp. COW1 TaxID=2795687 RepID=UPI0019160676|nr:S-methyl-5'-thioinosine phosphorylase [Thiohalobacter sp. COW1]BCO30419.1 putative S-methyl-5'-thioinosine phosphorylase [Thiohalobacter sp. COW1]
MAKLAIIGGSGLDKLKNLEIERREVLQTPYGEPSGPLTHGRISGTQVVFLPRHGSGHTIPPHKVNYRANIWALHHIGIQDIIAVAAVGGITRGMAPATLAFPDQIIDYTWGRENTFFDDDDSAVTHIDFTYPYCIELRRKLIETTRRGGITAIERGTYGATQGPRLETAAEIDRLERDGCDMVGMTGMPEAALAAEKGMCYASCAVVANWAAGRGEGDGHITMEEIEVHLKNAMTKVRGLLEAVIPAL